MHRGSSDEQGGPDCSDWEEGPEQTSGAGRQAEPLLPALEARARFPQRLASISRKKTGEMKCP